MSTRLIWVFFGLLYVIHGVQSEGVTYSENRNTRFSQVRKLVSAHLENQPRENLTSNKLFNWNNLPLMPLPSPSTENFDEYRQFTTTEFPTTAALLKSTPELAYSTAPKAEVISYINITEPLVKPKRKQKLGHQKGNRKKHGKKKHHKLGGKSSEKVLSAEVIEKRKNRARLRQERIERMERRKQKRKEMALKRQNRKKKQRLSTSSELPSTTESTTPLITISTTTDLVTTPSTTQRSTTPARRHESYDSRENAVESPVDQDNPVGDERMKDSAGFIVNAFVDDVMSGKLKTTTTEHSTVTENNLAETTMRNEMTKNDVWFGDLSCLNPFVLAPESIGAHITYRRKEFYKFVYMVAEYKCKPGLSLSTSHPWMICRNRKWLGSIPGCVEIEEPGNDATLHIQKPPCFGGRGNCDHLCAVYNHTEEVCSCYKGFRLQGYVCRDIDECSNNNGGCEHDCINTIGSYICTCPSGLRIADDKKKCIDINECLLNNGHGPCQDSCQNSWGSYSCSCGERDGLRGTRLAADGHTCLSSGDDCLSGAAGCSHDCINLPLGRGAYCTCPNGWNLKDDWKTCQDVDECADPDLQDADRKCDPGTCENLAGTYRCLEISVINDQPAELKTVICEDGMKPDTSGTTCEDIDECSNNNGGCSQRCVNTEGSFKCSCRAGYVFGPDGVTCVVGAVDVACPALYPPKHGFLECSRPNPATALHTSESRNMRYIRTRSGRRRVTNLPGTKCQLRCRKAFRVEGIFQQNCQHDGKWAGEVEGQCIRMEESQHVAFSY